MHAGVAHRLQLGHGATTPVAVVRCVAFGWSMRVVQTASARAILFAETARAIHAGEVDVEAVCACGREKKEELVVV